MLEQEDMKVSLKEYFEKQIAFIDRIMLAGDVAIKELTKAELTSIKEATKLALETLDDRFDTHNQFKEAQKDIIATLATKRELEACATEFRTGIASLNISRAELSGKASVKAVTISYIVSGIGLLIGIISLIIN